MGKTIRKNPPRNYEAMEMNARNYKGGPMKDRRDRRKSNPKHQHNAWKNDSYDD